MKLNQKVEEVLNKQINAEFWSAYLYLSMSAYFQHRGLKGFANWMRVQYQEELSHANKLFDYINERGGRVALEAIVDVDTDWDDLLDVFTNTYDHECKVTEMINNCIDVAVEVKDHATTTMLQWFVNEQVEEEATALEIIEQIRLVGESGQAIFLLDKEFAGRTFVDSTQSAN